MLFKCTEHEFIPIQYQEAGLYHLCDRRGVHSFRCPQRTNYKIVQNCANYKLKHTPFTKQCLAVVIVDYFWKKTCCSYVGSVLVPSVLFSVCQCWRCNWGLALDEGKLLLLNALWFEVAMTSGLLLKLRSVVGLFSGSSDGVHR